MSVQDVIKALSRVEDAYKNLHTSCPWGREELEEVQFFREYITKGNQAFLSAFNGYKKLKPVAYAIYQNPSSPQIKVGNCTKGFVFSGIKIAWADYLSELKKKEEASEPIDMLRSIRRRIDEARVGKEEQEALDKILGILTNPRNRSLNMSFERLVAASLVRRFLAQVENLVLSKEQQEANKKIGEKAKEIQREELKKVLKGLSEVLDEKERKEIKLKILNDRNPEPDKYVEETGYLAKAHISKNGLSNQAVQGVIRELSSTASQVRGKARETAMDLVKSMERSLGGKGTVSREDVVSIASNAEAMSLARRVFSYLKQMEGLKKSLEDVKKKMEAYENRLKEMERGKAQSQRNTAGNRAKEGENSGEEQKKNNARGVGENNKNSNTQKKLSFPENQKKRFEALFADIAREIAVLGELLRFLTADERRKNGPLGRAASAFRSLASGILSALDSIAEALGLKRIWSLEGILAVATEIGLQLL